MASTLEGTQQLAVARYLLMLLFCGILLLMAGMTVAASLQSAVWAVDPQLLGDRWFQATLLDAYLGFITFFVWVAYKERTAVSRIVWFVLIMCLGNMAMAGYMLLQLWRWNTEEGVAGLLLRRQLSSFEN